LPKKTRNFNRAATMASKKSAGKRSGGRKSGRRKSSGKRELISPRGDKRLVRRGKGGKFKESDDLGRSLKRDVKKRAKRTVKSGQGDRGDQKR
jgi:hypothetical protein